MARPKGSRNKSSQESDNIATTNAASEEANSIVDTDKSTALGYEGDPDLDPERAAIYDEYEKQANTETVPEAADKEVAPVEEPEEVKKDESEAPPVEEAAEAPAPEEAAIEEKKKEETKTVHYDALHEEREKRKLAQAKTRELEEKIKALEAQAASSRSVEQDNEYLTDEEKKVRELERSISELRAKDEARERENLEAKQRTIQEQREKNIADTDKSLHTDGYPGFQFLTSRVADELDKLIKEDPDNIVYDNPEGWKKIYREKVFPSVKGIFVQAEKKSLIDSKVEAKKDAALAGSPGSSPKKPEAKKDDGWSIEEYLENRRKNSIA